MNSINYVRVPIICSFAKYTDVHLNTLEWERVVNVSQGQPLLLPCDTGVPHPPNDASWMKDGQQLIPTDVCLPVYFVDVLF